MNILTSAPVAPLIARLFAEEAASFPRRESPAFASMSSEERYRLMRSKADYRELYGHLREFAIAISPDTGKLLYMLARSMRARSIVEFGTSFGISTLHLAAALRENGGGRLITSEFEPSKVVRA